MNNGEQYISLLLANRVYEIPRAAASKSVFLTSVLEMQDVDQVIPVPFIQNTTVAQILYDFFHDNPIAQTTWPPYLCYDVLLAANGMDMPSLLELCVEEIAARWSSSTEKEIRSTWGFDDNLTKKEKGTIQKENSLLEIFDTDTGRDEIDPWTWPPEMLALILSKLPTHKLARVRAVCVELCDIIHSMPGRGDLEVSANILQKNTNVPFVERHCLVAVDDKQQLESLQSLKKLQHLVIHYHKKIGVEGAKALSTFHNLKKLVIEWGNKIGPEGAKELSSLQNLQHLVIYDNNIGVKGTKALSSLQNLQHLVIYDNNIGAKGAKALSRLKNLTYLEIGPNNIGPKGAAALAALQNLKELVIGSNNDIGAEGTKALSTLQNLKHLMIWAENNIGAAGAAALASLHNLEELVIGSNNIGAEGATALSALRNLTHLEIWNNNIGLEGAMVLSSLQNLTYLEIGYCNNIGPEGTTALSTLQNLQRLKIEGNNNIGAKGIATLARLKKLQSLQIARHNNQFSKTDEKELQALLPDTEIVFC